MEKDSKIQTKWSKGKKLLGEKKENAECVERSRRHRSKSILQIVIQSKDKSRSNKHFENFAESKARE